MKTRKQLENLMWVSGGSKLAARANPPKRTPLEEQMLKAMLERIELYKKAVALTTEMLKANEARLRESSLAYDFAFVKGLSPENARLVAEYLRVDLNNS